MKSAFAKKLDLAQAGSAIAKPGILTDTPIAIAVLPRLGGKS
jgi:hypothetical protein